MTTIFFEKKKKTKIPSWYLGLLLIVVFGIVITYSNTHTPCHKHALFRISGTAVVSTVFVLFIPAFSVFFCAKEREQIEKSFFFSIKFKRECTKNFLLYFFFVGSPLSLYILNINVKRFLFLSLPKSFSHLLFNSFFIEPFKMKKKKIYYKW